MKNNTRAKVSLKIKYSKLKKAHYKERLFFTDNSFSGIFHLLLCPLQKNDAEQEPPDQTHRNHSSVSRFTRLQLQYGIISARIYSIRRFGF